MTNEEVAHWAWENADRILAAVEMDDNIGFCVGCDEEQGGLEPDARERSCESCGRPLVYAAEELLFHIAL